MRFGNIMFIAITYWIILNNVTQFMRYNWRFNCSAVVSADTCDSFDNEEPSTAIRLLGILITNMIAFFVTLAVQMVSKMIYNRIWIFDMDDEEYFYYFEDEGDAADTANSAVAIVDPAAASIELRTVDQVFGFREGTFAYRFNDDDLLNPLVDSGLTYDLLFCNPSRNGEWPDVTMYIDQYRGRTFSWSGVDDTAENTFREARVRQITSRDLGNNDDELEGETGAGEVMFVLEGYDNIYELTDYLIDD